MTASDHDRDSAEPRPIRDGIDTARHQIRDTAEAARDAALATGDRVRDIAHDALASSRDAAASAKEGLSGGLDNAPLAALAGGAAVGLLVGALLPRSERETAVFGTLGAKVIEVLREAAEAARDAGREKLDEVGLSREGAQSAARGIIDAALAAAVSAGSAATDTAKQKIADVGN